MFKIFADLADLYALYDLHSQKSKVSHYRKGCNPIPIDQAKEFFYEPNIPEIDFLEIRKDTNYQILNYQYQSELNCEYVINNTVPGKYYKNNERDNKFVIVVIHGWRMSAKRIDNVVLHSLMKENYDFYLYTLPYHYARTPVNTYNGELMISANVERTVKAIQQAVVDLRALIGYIKNQNKKVVLIGISLGGHITNLTSVFEKEIDLLVSVFFANNIAYIAWNGIAGKYIKKDFVENGGKYEDLIEYWKVTIPSNYKPLVNKENILLFCAKYDRYIPEEDSELLCKAWGSPQRIDLKIGHAGIVLNKRLIFEEIIEFIKNSEVVS